MDKTFNAGIKVETASVDRREMQYLYKDGEDYVFMDTDTFEQTNVPDAVVGDSANYMLENQMATVAIHENAALYIELAPIVELVISYTEPGLVGDRSTSGTKPATLETGASIQVPLFIVTGEKVKVDTRSGAYHGSCELSAAVRTNGAGPARTGAERLASGLSTSCSKPTCCAIEPGRPGDPGRAGGRGRPAGAGVHGHPRRGRVCAPGAHR